MSASRRTAASRSSSSSTREQTKKAASAAFFAGSGSERSILYRLGRAGHGVVVFDGKVRIARQLAIEAIAKRRLAIPKFLDGKRHELAADDRGPSIMCRNLRAHLTKT
jgi:hypothetical protein